MNRVNRIGVTLAIVGLTSVILAQNVDRPNAPPADRVLSFEVSEATQLAFDLSPDGRAIVFDLLGQLWTLPADGGVATPLTDAARDRSEDADPVFSPDGRSIAFRSNRPDGRGLFVISATGGPIRRLTTGADLAPAWSPDGRRLAFTRQDAPFIVDIGTATVTRVNVAGLETPAVRDPQWSNDGTRLLLVNAAAVTFAGGPAVQVATNGGPATSVVTGDRLVLAPTYSPDQTALAYFSRGADGRAHLWAQGADGSARQLTEHAETTPRRVRWSRDGSRLLYVGEGHIWSVRAAGGTATPIPFTARIRVARPMPAFAPVRFHAPGARVPARGHMGLALAPDGRSIAMIALGGLWVFAPGSTPRQLVPVPGTAAGLTWSPDGRQIAWSAGPQGAEDLFITDIATRATRRVTALPGQEARPSWSPDGRWLAFVHWQKAVLDTPPSQVSDSLGRLRVAPLQPDIVERIEQTRDLGDLPFNWITTFFPLSQETPQWSPDSQGVLVFDGARASIKMLDGPSRDLASFPAPATFVRWRVDGALVYITGNALWTAPVRISDGMVGTPVPLNDDAALYPSVSNDGLTLYVSSDGLRLRAATGAVRMLGWPLQLNVADANDTLVVRGGRVVDGTGTPPSAPRDILVRQGRIARMAPSGELRVPANARVLDAQGRFVMPGLIDLHAHAWDDLQLPGYLANGVTAIRDTGAAMARLIALRDAIDAGQRPGPRIVAGGFQFVPSDRLGTTGDIIQLVAGGAEVGRAIALVRAFDGRYLKMRIPANWANGVRLLEQSRAAGLRASGHIASPLAFVSAGIDGKEHLGQAGDRADEAVYDDLVQLTRAARMWVVPTIVAFANTVRLMDDPALIDAPDNRPFVSPFLRWWARRQAPTGRALYARLANDARASARRYAAAGITLGAGSDVATVPSALHGELEELVGAGLSPAMAIAAATGTAATILGADAEIGTVAEGKRADLVLLDRDPTTDIRNTRAIWRVIKDGVVYDASSVAAHAAALSAVTTAPASPAR